jgi:hypothetical protein
VWGCGVFLLKRVKYLRVSGVTGILSSIGVPTMFLVAIIVVSRRRGIARICCRVFIITMGDSPLAIVGAVVVVVVIVVVSIIAATRTL